MRGLLAGLIAVIADPGVSGDLGASMFLFYIPIWPGVAVVVLGIGLFAGGERVASSVAWGTVCVIAPIADLNSNC